MLTKEDVDIFKENFAKLKGNANFPELLWKVTGLSVFPELVALINEMIIDAADKAACMERYDVDFNTDWGLPKGDIGFVVGATDIGKTASAFNTMHEAMMLGYRCRVKVPDFPEPAKDFIEKRFTKVK